MTTMGQLAYETFHRRNPEALAWENVSPSLQCRWQKTACKVADAVEPGVELIRAENAQLKADVEKWKSAAAAAFRATATAQQLAGMAGEAES